MEYIKTAYIPLDYDYDDLDITNIVQVLFYY